MTFYLLTAATDHESEDPVFLAATLDEAKAAAQLPGPGAGAPDEFCIYEAQPGTRPELILYNDVSRTWDAATHQTVYDLRGWTPA